VFLAKKVPTRTAKLIRAANSCVSVLEAYERLAVRAFILAMLVYELVRAAMR